MEPFAEAIRNTIAAPGLTIHANAEFPISGHPGARIRLFHLAPDGVAPAAPADYERRIDATKDLEWKILLKPGRNAFEIVAENLNDPEN